MQTRKSFLQTLVAVGLGTSMSPRIWAQRKFPSKPVQVWVGFPGGGALDVATRIVTNAMSDEGIRPIVVMNKPGASATIASAQVARDEADGHSLLLATSSNMGIAPFLYAKLPYDVSRDFVPVAQFAIGRNVFYAGKGTGIKDFREMLVKVRANPGKLNFASPGRGTTPHLCFEMLKARDKLFIVHVPFSGSPAALTGVAAGEVEFGVDAIGPAQAFIRSGRVLPLAQTGNKRSAALPDVPTLQELGFDGLPSGTFLGLSAPAQTPEPVLQELRGALGKSLAKPVVVKQLADAGFDVEFVEGAAFARLISGEAKMWESAVKYSGAAQS